MYIFHRYWYNPETKASTWEKPDLQHSPKQSTKKKSHQDTQGNATWQECTTDSGMKYWYNRLTKTSTWEQPKELADMLGKPGEQKQEENSGGEWKEYTTDDGHRYSKITTTNF